MKSYIKYTVLTLFSLFALIGAAFADPINVEDVNIERDNGDRIVLVTLDNVNPDSGVHTDLDFKIEELGLTKSKGPVTVDSNYTKTFTYKLSEVADISQLKKGESYNLEVSTEDDSTKKAFQFGSVRDTDGLDLLVERIDVNGQRLADGDILQVENGETVDVSIRFEAEQNVDDARLQTFIEGYEHATIEDSTEIFSAREGRTYVKDMSLELPDDMDSEQDYKLRIAGANDLSGLTYEEFDLYVDTQRHRVDIDDIEMTPSGGVEAGQNMIANVRMNNRGQMSQQSVKAIFEVPELGIKESNYISNLDSGEVATSDDLLVYMPSDAEEGEYTAEVTVEYNNGYDSTTEEYTVNVLSPTVEQEEDIVLSYRDQEEIVAGEDNEIEVVAANPSDVSRAISIASANNDWADVDVSPSMAMISGGSDRAYTITVTPDSDVEGERDLELDLKEGDELKSTFTINTNVVAGEEEPTELNLVNIAIAALLVLAIIILLALIVAIVKRRGRREEDDFDREEYY